MPRYKRHYPPSYETYRRSRKGTTILLRLNEYYFITRVARENKISVSGILRFMMTPLLAYGRENYERAYGKVDGKNLWTLVENKYNEIWPDVFQSMKAALEPGRRQLAAIEESAKQHIEEQLPAQVSEGESAADVPVEGDKEPERKRKRGRKRGRPKKSLASVKAVKGAGKLDKKIEGGITGEVLNVKI